MVIRYLAGGSVYDIADLHGVAVSTLHKVVAQVVAAINRTFRIKFPSTHDELQRSAVAFAGLSNGVIDGVVGAVDGVIIKITKPSYNGTQYYSRKGFYGFNVQAVCDAERRIVYLAISSSGSTHDSTAFKATKLYAKMEAGKLAGKYYLVGDDAYSSCRQMLCPCSTRGSAALWAREPRVFQAIRQLVAAGVRNLGSWATPIVSEDWVAIPLPV